MKTILKLNGYIAYPTVSNSLNLNDPLLHPNKKCTTYLIDLNIDFSKSVYWNILLDISNKINYDIRLEKLNILTK